MIRTLAWKELREHQGIWITMVFMSIVMGIGLSKLVTLGGDTHIALPVAAFTILGMAATYGVVCGAMMFAGEHEAGTLTFLDIFHGRRGRLWGAKFAIGCVLAITQALGVAALLSFLQPESPRWVGAIVGYRVEIGAGVVVVTDPSVWFMVLPVVTLEAFFWGLLGSSLSQKVLAGAAVAAAIFTPVLLVTLLAPPEVFGVIRVIGVLICLTISFSLFVNQSLDSTAAPRAEPRTERLHERKERFLEKFERLEREDEQPGYYTEPVSVADAPDEAAPTVEKRTPRKRARTKDSPRAPRSAPLDLPDQPSSPTEALWWLTWQQAHSIIWPLLVAAAFLGLVVVPLNFQILWPIATLLLGVACGVAVFASEQRDLSYQHLAAQHLPLRQIWRFKIGFWLAAAVLIATPMLIGTIVISTLTGNLDRFSGTFIGLVRPWLFLFVWLLYGFATGQVFVWLCRKSILALLISMIAAVGAVGLWMPALICGGMGGWQLLIPPIVMLTATCVLMRAWAGGRLWERKPIAALCGYGGAIFVWALFVFGYRAIEIPNVAEPLDQAVFRESLPKNNDAAKEIQKAVAEFSDVNGPWFTTLRKAAQMPLGVIDVPRSDGQTPVATHLPVCRSMADAILARAARVDRDPALDHMAVVLMLSRTLRSKASTESYLAGVEIELKTMNEFDNLLRRGKPAPPELRRVLQVLNRHADETPPPLDCAKTECFRSSGVVANPTQWTFATPGGDARMPERWLANGIAAAQEAPWEAERRTRIWRLVWSGLLRHMETPHWELPADEDNPRVSKPVAATIMANWLPNPQGGPSQARVTRLLDSSWLADTQIFPAFKRLRNAATRAQWRRDSTRIAVALALYQMEHGRSAPDLNALVPNYLPALPIDVYSGESYQYRIEMNGHAIVWSTGPDRVDHGGLRNGINLADDDATWRRADFDLMMTVPRW